MKRTRRTAGIILACLLLPPLLVGGLLKAGYYTSVTHVLPPWRCQWYLGPTDVMVNYVPVPGYRLTLNDHDYAIYCSQDRPTRIKIYRLSAKILDQHGRDISGTPLDVHDLAGNVIDDAKCTYRVSGYNGLVDHYVWQQGTYDVLVEEPGYLPIKKRVQVGPNGAFVKFVLPRTVRGGAPSRRLPASARS